MRLKQVGVLIRDRVRLRKARVDRLVPRRWEKMGGEAAILSSHRVGDNAIHLFCGLPRNVRSELRLVTDEFSNTPQSYPCP